MMGTSFARPEGLMKPIQASVLAIAVACGLALVPALAAADAGVEDGDAYLVRVSAATPAMFDVFNERGFAGNAAEGLREAFADPNSAIHSRRRGTCTMRWSPIGLRAVLTNYGQAGNPCDTGYFLEAHLTGSRWHTPKGLRIGSAASVARRQAVCGRGRLRCQTQGYPKGYVLGVHRIDCARGLFPNVIAVVRRAKVVSLWVYTHGCE
jgi:hypothetical protein